MIVWTSRAASPSARRRARVIGGLAIPVGAVPVQPVARDHRGQDLRLRRAGRVAGASGRCRPRTSPGQRRRQARLVNRWATSPASVAPQSPAPFPTRPAATGSASGWSGVCMVSAAAVTRTLCARAIARARSTGRMTPWGEARMAPHHDDRSARMAGFDDETVNAVPRWLRCRDDPALTVSSSKPAMRALPSSWWGAIIAPRRTASFVRCLRARAIPRVPQHPGDERGRHDADPPTTQSPSRLLPVALGKGRR